MSSNEEKSGQDKPNRAELVAPEGAAQPAQALVSADDADTDLDITLNVRHNRPSPTVEGELESLGVRHNRPSPTLDASAGEDEPLNVRHNRPSPTATDLDVSLAVRHNRPLTSLEVESESDPTLNVRHNRPLSE